MSGLVGQIINNTYHFTEYIGRGGMAEVYKVWDSQRVIHLAAKVLHKDMALDKVFLRRFKREADTLTQLQHPHIIRSYGLQQEGRLAFLLMDFVEGESLKELIFDAKGPLSVEQIRNILRPVTGALHYAHSQGFIHCDIKPANIMLDKYGEVRVADFGIARVTDGATATMVGAGTPAYMAPEQVKGLDPTPQTDIYALGIVLFEMLTGGERPFTGEMAEITGTVGERVRWEQIKAEPPSMKRWNPNIPPGLDALVKKCLAKDPVDRYQNPLDVMNDFERAVNGEAQKQPASKPAPKPQDSTPSESVKPLESVKEYNKNLEKGNTKKIFTRISVAVIGVFLIGLLFIGGAVSSAQNHADATSTAQAWNVQSTATQRSNATATKQEQNARATATKQEQNARATATKQEQNARATATARNVFSKIPDEIASEFQIIKLFDSFDNSGSWGVGPINDSSFYSGSQSISSGKYVWNLESIIDAGFVAFGSVPEVSVKDFYMQVTARRTGGDRSYSCYGVTFRDTQEGYYIFSICDDQNYEISYYQRYSEGKIAGWKTVRFGWVETGLIASEGENQIGVKSVEDQIELYVNGNKIFSFVDTYQQENKSGDLSLSVNIYRSSPVEFEFDDLIILTP